MATNIKPYKRVFVGSGAPQDGDLLCNTTFYPIDSIYTDKDSGTSYVRNGVSKVAADWQPSSGGSGASGAPVLQSPDTTLWQIGVNDSGALQTTQVVSGTAGTLHLFSADNTEWNVTVTNAGALVTTAI